ncbi:ATP-binding protein [candidate division KSB1 bacterium]|nr:ATP-binding protein [candidate division KSB1 bacterium]
MPNTNQNSIITKFAGIRPRYIVIISLVLIVVLFASGVIELRQAKKEIHFLMEEEATTLWASITKSATNAIYSFDEIELLVEERLFTVARMVARLDQNTKLTSTTLQQIVDANNVYRINLFDRHGKRILSNVPLGDDSLHQNDPHTAALRDILNGDARETALGFVNSRHPGEQRFAVAVARTSGGAIIVNIDAHSMLDFRRSIGVGRLMQDIGDYKNIAYLVLQDSSGILLASSDVARISSFSSDRFLMDAFKQQRQTSRFTSFKNKNVFEFVGPFVIDNESLGLLRIGLVTNHLNDAQDRIKRRLIIMSVVTGFLMLIVINFLTVNQNYRLINDAYRRIRTYSSNILQRMTDAVVAIGADTTLTMINTAALELFKSLSLQLQTPSPTQLRTLLPHLFETLETGQPITNIEHTITLDGKQHVLEISTSVIINSDGRVETAFAVIKDFTERRRLEESLQRQDKLVAMGQLASGVAHEIRNPLNSIGMISQRLNKEFEPTSDQEEYLQLTNSMVKEVRRINDIIQQFLKFAKPPKLNITPIDLSEIVREVAFLVTSQADQQHIKLHAELSRLPDLLFDVNQMKQALLNLLQNSMDAIGENGDIWLRTEMTSSDVKLHIKDNGAGIDELTLSKIFNLYFTTKSTGTGLGLSMVHQIISQHQGHIDVTSEPGVGTEFIITFPGDYHG